MMSLTVGFCAQEVRQGRRAAQNVQSNPDPDEDVLDATLGDMAVEAHNSAVSNEHEQVRCSRVILKGLASCKTKELFILTRYLNLFLRFYPYI